MSLPCHCMVRILNVSGIQKENYFESNQAVGKCKRTDLNSVCGLPEQKSSVQLLAQFSNARRQCSANLCLESSKHYVSGHLVLRYSGCPCLQCERPILFGFCTERKTRWPQAWAPRCVLQYTTHILTIGKI